MARFKVLSQHMSGGTKKRHEKHGTDQPIFGQRFEPAPSEYEASVLTTQP
jgi:hypothetical protein